MPSIDCPGEIRETITIQDEATSLIKLPDEYSVIPAVACSVSELKVPEVHNAAAADPRTKRNTDDTLQEERQWLRDALQLLDGSNNWIK